MPLLSQQTPPRSIHACIVAAQLDRNRCSSAVISSLGHCISHPKLIDIVCFFGQSTCDPSMSLSLIHMHVLLGFSNLPEPSRLLTSRWDGPWRTVTDQRVRRLFPLCLNVIQRILIVNCPKHFTRPSYGVMQTHLHTANLSYTYMHGHIHNPSQFFSPNRRRHRYHRCRSARNLSSSLGSPSQRPPSAWVISSRPYPTRSCCRACFGRQQSTSVHACRCPGSWCSKKNWK
jgi:hypothetical protein